MQREPSLALDDISGPVYEALGVDVNASKNDIVNAYRKLAKEWHPDRHRGDEGAKTIFQQIARAYQILTNPVSRECHDLEFGLLNRLYIQDYLVRYFYMLLSPQGLGLQVNQHKSLYDFTVELNERQAALTVELSESSASPISA